MFNYKNLKIREQQLEKKLFEVEKEIAVKQANAEKEIAVKQANAEKEIAVKQANATSEIEFLKKTHEEKILCMQKLYEYQEREIKRYIELVTKKEINFEQNKEIYVQKIECPHFEENKFFKRGEVIAVSQNQEGAYVFRQFVRQTYDGQFMCAKERHSLLSCEASHDVWKYAKKIN